MSQNPAAVFGTVDYAQVINSIKSAGLGKPYTKQIDVTASQTETHELTDFPEENALLLFIQVVAIAGTTDSDLSIHNDDTYTAADMLYRVENVSIADVEPTGGAPNSVSGLPYVEADQEGVLHVQTTENSGNNGTILLKIQYI